MIRVIVCEVDDRLGNRLASLILESEDLKLMVDTERLGNLTLGN